jgi:NAD(P)-dependent dehydrogenase (short-subunit alcohol dehydrogenase family)
MSTKTILITGGSKGIGAACVKRFASDGWNVAFNYSRDDGTAAKVEAECDSRAKGYQADLGNKDSIDEFFDSALEQFGTIDALILNAAYQQKAVFDETDWTLMEKTFSVNVFGNVHLAQRFVEHRKFNGGGGSVVVHGSNQAEFVNPTGFAYALSKAALHHMVKHVASATADDNIRVNGVILGWFDTEGEHRFIDPTQIPEQAKDGIPMGRAGDPSEAANLAHYLISDASSYMTGALVRLDGGFALAPDLST